ncbi:hypothetical protein [Vibrio variabilis]|uniref:hypothetical protein n=1 Tax=Vibrio variabilis TaxID=990271 RepID=UPI000DDA6A5B|nr:hypothetical protein [Vibrio variabilis]
MKKTLITTLIAGTFAVSAQAADYDVQVMAGAGFDKSGSIAIETHIDKTWIVGVQGNFGGGKDLENYQHRAEADNYFDYKGTQTNNQGTLYGGYRFKEGALEGLSLRAGATYTTITSYQVAEGLRDGSPLKLEDKSKSTGVAPFVGIGYEVYKDVSINLTHTFGTTKHEFVGFTGAQDLNSSVTSLLVGFKF